MQVIESEEGGRDGIAKLLLCSYLVEIKPATCTTFLGRCKPLKGCTKAQY